MATPIKITPVLKGESSRRFNEKLNAQKNEKISSEEKQKIKDLVFKVISNSKKL
jgi:hypothetical protein